MRQRVLDLIERHLGRGHFSGEENVSVRCPFHKGGQETRPSFSINVTNGVWQCFTCKANGSLPKLLRGLGLPRHIVDAELKDLRGELEANRHKILWKKRMVWQTTDPLLAPTILPETLLKPYEYLPLNLVNAGFDPAWLQWLEVGFDRTNNRVMYPIRDVYGNLAGMSGGSVIAGTIPKYKVYQGKHIDPMSGKDIGSDYGPWFDEQYPDYVFHNHDYIWNFDQVYPRMFFGRETQTLVIVEGFKACMWLLQHGYQNTVALMGSSMSDRQRNLLHRLNAHIVLFLDNDWAGKVGTDSIARELQQFQPGVRIAQYPADTSQPDDLEPDELSAAIQGSEPYPIWKRKNLHVNGRTKARSTGSQQ